MKSNTPRSMPREGTPQGLHKEGSASGAQLELLLSDSRLTVDAKSPLARIEDLYELLRAAVQAHGGVLAFSSAMGEGEPDTGKRLRRGFDGNGRLLRAFLDFLGFLDLGARHRFLVGLCVLWGYKEPIPRSGLTAEEKYQVVAGALSEDALRAMEKMRGLPAGSLQP
jgi:hypothetical protein